MSTNKMLREFRRKVAITGSKVVSSANVNGHVHVAVRHNDGRTQRITLGSSPSCAEFAIKQGLDELRRFRDATSP